MLHSLEPEFEMSHRQRKNHASRSVRTACCILVFLTFILTSLHKEGRVARSIAIQDENEYYGHELMFYNFNQKLRRGTTSMTLEEANYPKGGPVFATLVSNSMKDIDSLCTALKSLSFLEDATGPSPVPVLIFNENDLNAFQLGLIIDSTRRPIAFPVADLSQFPPGFDSYAMKPQYTIPGRSRWGYYQAMRFWITEIWRHPALEAFDAVVRFDPDSCIKASNKHLPHFENDGITYHSHYIGLESEHEYVDGLLDFAVGFLKHTGKEANNQMLWRMAQGTWRQNHTLPLFQTDFEMIRKGFMQREDVSAFHEALTEKAPFGIYRHRWSTSAVRFLTMTIFATNDMVMTSEAKGYDHKEGCSKTEVDKALWAHYSAANQQLVLPTQTTIES